MYIGPRGTAFVVIALLLLVIGVDSYKLVRRWLQRRQ